MRVLKRHSPHKEWTKECMALSLVRIDIIAPMPTLCRGL